MYRKKLALLLVLVLLLSTLLSPMALQAQEDPGYIEAATYDTEEMGVNGTPEDPAAKFSNSDRMDAELTEDNVRVDQDNPFGAEKSISPEESELLKTADNGAASLQTEKLALTGELAYRHVKYLSETIGQRVAKVSDDSSAIDTVPSGEVSALNYIKDVLEDFYTVEVQPFTAELTDKGGNTTGYVESANVIAVKPGLSPKEIIVGAHYDSVAVNGSRGADDNASGVAILLEAAEILADMETPYTIKFVGFGAEELGLLGSEYYVSQMTDAERTNTVAMINLDSCLVGDNMYVYGGEGEKGFVRELALSISKELDLNLKTNPGLNPEYPAGTTGDWSDHAPFKNAGIPFGYFEATNWELGEMDGYTQVNPQYGENGEIWHTQYDNLDYINSTFPGRAEERLGAFSKVLVELLVRLGEDQVINGMKVSNKMLSMTEIREIRVNASFGYVPDLKNLEWTLGGKPFSEWKKYKSGSYSGNPFVTFSVEPYIENGIIKATIKFDLPYGTTDLSSTSSSSPIRRLYPSLIGCYKLEVRDTGGDKSISETLEMKPYDSYHTYDEFKPAIDEIFNNVKGDRYLEYKSLGETVDGRDAHFVILAKDKESIDKYLNETVDMMTNKPGELMNNSEGHKVAIWFNNIHPDEAPGSDAIFELLEELATKDTISYKLFGSIDLPKDKYGYSSNLEDPSQEEDITIDVAKALDNIIFLFNFTENPDGRYYNTRGNVNGFDINRDNAYQTQVESRLTTSEIAKWKPISFLDFHGFVNGFLLEPCTTPHEPNYEYDLLIDNMAEQANLMGRAGIANTIYTNYEIPYEDYPGTWDDGTPSYTATYAMFHGALGHTIEIPDLNQHSVDALFATGLASTSFVLDNEEELRKNQLEYFERGIEGIDSREVDKHMLNAAGDVIGRPRGEFENFFPEYYVLPVSGKLQKNSLEAYRMAEYLIRNGVKVEELKYNTTVNGITYPRGSFVVDMHQAMRGYANCVLYDGYDVSDFEELYAEIVMNFHDARGFDRYPVRVVDAFAGDTTAVEEVIIPQTEIAKGRSPISVIRNTSTDAIRAVNRLLHLGKKVKMLQTSGKGYEAGDFLVNRSDLTVIGGEYLLDIVNYNNDAKAKELILPKVAMPAAGHLKFALQELGFELAGTAVSSNIIVADSRMGIKSYLEEGKPYIGVGGSGMYNIKNSGLLPGFDYTSSYMYYEGLLRAKALQSDPVTAYLGETDVLYNPQGAYIKSMPQGAKIITQVSDEDNYFKAGWWTGNEEVKGKPLAIKVKAGNADTIIIANYLVNKAHPQKEWRMLANAIFTLVSDID